MRAADLKRMLAAADPVDRDRLERLDLAAGEADLLAAVEGEDAAGAAADPDLAPAYRRPPERRRTVLALGTAVAAAVVAAILVFGGGGAGHPSPAYGADLVRFAESSPLLLLDGPGWRVQHVNESRAREGTEGSMEFITGKQIPYATITITGNDETGQHESGLPPAAVRQRKVDLSWRHESLATAIAAARSPLRPHPHGRHFVRLPVLDTTAFVDTHAEVFVNQGGPEDREMIALWSEGGYLLELHAAVPDLAGMEERLDWLTRVDSQTWLDAMPAAVVKAADFEGTVREMLEGIPLPKTFSIARVPDEGLATSREAIGFQVAGTVSCLWLRQWAGARNSGDLAAAAEAERAMATSHRWKILTEAEPTNGYAPLVWEVADDMKKGYAEYAGHRRKLLPKAEALDCARIGLPLMAKKIKRQREHGVPPPPD